MIVQKKAVPEPIQRTLEVINCHCICFQLLSSNRLSIRKPLRTAPSAPHKDLMGRLYTSLHSATEASALSAGFVISSTTDILSGP